MNVPKKFINPEGGVDMEKMAQSYAALEQSLAERGQGSSEMPAAEAGMDMPIGPSFKARNRSEVVGEQIEEVEKNRNMVAELYSGDPSALFSSLDGQAKSLTNEREMMQGFVDMPTEPFEASMGNPGSKITEQVSEEGLVAALEEDTDNPIVNVVPNQDGSLGIVRLSDAQVGGPIIERALTDSTDFSSIAVLTAKGRAVSVLPVHARGGKDQLEQVKQYLGLSADLLERQGVEYRTMLLDADELSSAMKR